MKSQKTILAVLAGVLISTISVPAQDTAPVPAPPDVGAVGGETVTVGVGGVAMMGINTAFFSIGNGKTVTGAPFSAQEVTTSAQSLSDGNQITRNNTVQIYRDSAGRVRREMTLSMIGPWSVSGKPKLIIDIQDPVNQVHYFLDPSKKIAYKMPIPTSESGRSGFNVVMRTQRGQMQTQFPDAAPVLPPSESGKSHFKAMMRAQQGQMQTQSLGVEMMQGLEAQGTEETFTIPAKAIGNEKPIVSTTEKWYSPDLQTVVLMKRNDPRFGNTTFEFKNISRNEPPASLFQVPAGYTVQNGPPPPPGGKGTFIYKSSN